MPRYLCITLRYGYIANSPTRNVGNLRQVLRYLTLWEEQEGLEKCWNYIVLGLSETLAVGWDLFGAGVRQTRVEFPI